MQGDRAVGEVTAAIQRLDADPEVDVIIVARGGGDFQNLLVFSDEGLVRAAAACTTPIVSAIGHEADRPLLDEVADLRASTPTDAAKRVVPDVAEELARVQQARARIGIAADRRSSRTEIDRLDQLRTPPGARRPADWLVDSRADELVRYVARGEELLDAALDRAGLTRVAELTGHLRALSPQRTLDRGYAIAQLPVGRGAPRRRRRRPAGTPLLLTLADGTVVPTSTGARSPARPLPARLAT